MKEVNLYRHSDDDTETLGLLKYIRPDDSQFNCLTLERPWKEDAPDISCIPKGSYLCTYNRSPHLSELARRDVFTYEVLNVPNRAGIRIHSANYYSQLKGCIALGKSYAQLNQDGEVDVTGSFITVEDFEAEMNKEDFTLVIQ